VTILASYTPIGLLFLYVRPYVEEIVSEADDDSTITYWGTMLNTIGKYRGKP
jgi:hypothetical protein